MGGAGLAVAAVLILAERLGKAIRSPAESAGLADAASGVEWACGIFAAVQGAGALAGGAAAGLLYDHSVPSLVIAVVLAQAVALLMLLGVPTRTLQHRHDPA
ncbi:hypothetical protein KBX71_08775 [Micromonospora sp. D93]|uniref:hypothetical protein n=1 Tax=Micromonospora sp. D93 TaxID=2824886 RepID=UPI001B362B87|nr:hypothetical protein [Micromonospora sp. D93]MBQ1017957.1 hypothetical protein [Micromonospora sp. D93]